MSQTYIKRILNARVYDVARETPLDVAPLLSSRLGNQAFLKREDLQPVFSFKCRGAYNKMSRLNAAARQAGVVAASAGNHAQGVALAAQTLYQGKDRDTRNHARNQSGCGPRARCNGRVAWRFFRRGCRACADIRETGRHDFYSSL